METFSAFLAICAGNSPVPAQRPVTRSFDVFFDLRLNKRLSKQSWGWWFETLSCPLWRHLNAEEYRQGNRMHLANMTKQQTNHSTTRPRAYYMSCIFVNLLTPSDVTINNLDIWTSAGILSIGPLGTHFSDIFENKFQHFHGRKCALQCRLRNGDHFSCLNVLNQIICISAANTPKG